MHKFSSARILQCYEFHCLSKTKTNLYLYLRKGIVLKTILGTIFAFKFWIYNIWCKMNQKTIFASLKNSFKENLRYNFFLGTCNNDPHPYLLISYTCKSYILIINKQGAFRLIFFILSIYSFIYTSYIPLQGCRFISSGFIIPLEGFLNLLFTRWNFTQGELHSTRGIQISILGVYNSTGGIRISILGVLYFHWKDSDIHPGGL